MTKKWERVGRYLEKYADALVFDQFQEGFLKREKIDMFMRQVPVPMRLEDVVSFHTQKGLDVMHVAQNMIRVLGINPSFSYAQSYLRYIRMYFNENIAEAVVKDGEQRAREGNVEEALIYFRAALVMAPQQKNALFDYGLACRQLAEQDSDDEAYRGAMKADSIEAFEELAGAHPDFAPTYYYLGYIYLNMGLYTKAQLTFRLFLQLSEPRNGGNLPEKGEAAKGVGSDFGIDDATLSEQRKEICQRLEQLTEPVKIEGGINHILAGRPEVGLSILEPYVDGPYDTWWPLHYYLGQACVSTGCIDEAILRFRRVLQLNPSHAETMNELAEIYEAKGDAVMGEKYRNKIELVKEK